MDDSNTIIAYLDEQIDDDGRTLEEALELAKELLGHLQIRVLALKVDVGEEE